MLWSKHLWKSAEKKIISRNADVRGRGGGGGWGQQIRTLADEGGGSKNGKNLRTSFIINTLICACTSSRCLGKRGGYSKRKGTLNCVIKNCDKVLKISL